MKNLVNKIIIQTLLFITAVIFGFKFVQLDIVLLTNPLVSVITWSLLTMIFVFDFDPIFKVKEKWLIPSIKAGVFGLIAFAMWRTGNTNDIIVALSLIATGILSYFVITWFFEGEDINFIDKITRYASVLAGALLLFDIITGYFLNININNTNMMYLIVIIISQLVNRGNIEYLTFVLSKDEECKTNFSEKDKTIKFIIESVVQSAFYITMFLLVSKTLEAQLISMFPEFKNYEILLCLMIATSVIATHSMEAKKHMLVTVTSNIRWVAKFSIRMILLFFTILFLEEFRFEYLIIIGFIFVIVMMFTKFITTNLMSKRSYRLPSYILIAFMYYSSFGYIGGTIFNFAYSDLRVLLNVSLSLLFILFSLHKLFGKKEKTKTYRLEAIAVIASITISLSIIANTIIFGFAISVSGALSSIGINDFSSDQIKFINIILLSGSAILAYIPVTTKSKLSTLIFASIKWVGIFYIFNSVINIASIASNGLEMTDYVTIAAALVSIVIARGISENRIKFGWVITFGLLLVFTIEFVYMAVNWMNLFDISTVNFNGFRVLYAIYFLLIAFAYVYIRNMRIGKSSRVYSGVRFITSAVITSVLFLAMVLGKPAPNMFDLNKVDQDILEDVMSGIMEEFPSVDWCEILDETGVGETLGVDCGNYIILPEDESYLNSFRDGVATEFDPFTGKWNIEDQYGQSNSSEGTNHSVHESFDYQSIMNDPAILSSWFDEKSDYNIKLEIPFGATRNTVPMPMYADLTSTSEDLIIDSDEANIVSISKLVKMDYTIDYRMLNETGTQALVNLMNGSTGTTNNITDGYVEVPSSMTTLINELVSEFQNLSIGQASGDYNVMNAISAYINTKYDIISGLPQNPAAMTITDLDEFKWYDNSPIEDEIESGTLTYSSAVSLQSLMASRLNIKNRISNQLVPMTSENGVPGLFPLGVPRIEMVARTPNGGVWTDVQLATPVPSNNSGVLVSGLSSGEEIFLRRNVVESVVDEASFVTHNPTDFSSSNGFIYGENPYGSANVTTSDVAFNVTYNPMFTSPMELFTYGSQTYNGSANGINISNSFGVSQQGLNIPEFQLHTAKLPNMKLNDTLREISLNDYNRVVNNDGSGTLITDATMKNIAATIHASNSINDDNDPTVIQTITQARVIINTYIDEVLNSNEELKEIYSANRQAFIDGIFVEYNRLLGIDLRLVTGYTANQGADGVLDANPSHMFELYVDDSNEKWIPLPDYIQSSRQVIASREVQDGTSNIDSIFDVIQDEVGSNESFDNFDYIGKRNETITLSTTQEKMVNVDLGTEVDIETNSNFAILDPIFNDDVFGYGFNVISGSNLLSNVTNTTFTKVAAGDVVIDIYYLLPSTGERVVQRILITDTGYIPVVFEGIDITDVDAAKAEIGNVYSIVGDGNHYTVTAYAGTSIDYCEFIELIHFANSSKPSETADASNLDGLNSCVQPATSSFFQGVYTGNIDGVDYNGLNVNFSITTLIIDTDLGGGSNSDVILDVYEGEKFNIKTFLEHHDLVGVEVGDIWINGVQLPANSEYLFEMSSSASREVLEINFDIVGGINNSPIPTNNILEIDLYQALIEIYNIRELNDVLSGSQLHDQLINYVSLREPNTNIAYLDSSGNLASSIDSAYAPAPWFLNTDRHNINYDLSMVTSLNGVVDGANVVDADTRDQVVLFSKGLWQNIRSNDLNAYLPTIDLDVDVDLSYSYETTYSYSIDGVDFIRTNRTTSEHDFRVVDDKIVVTVTETNRTPNELTSISADGWEFRNKLGESVGFDVDKISTSNTAEYLNGYFWFNELSADYAPGHEFRLWTWGSYSGVVTEEIVVFNVQLNDVDVDLVGQTDDYYVGYIYDISSLMTITDWNGLDATTLSSIVWSIDGGASFNPANFVPQVGITDFVASITYAQRTTDYRFSLDIVDKVAENILPVILASDNVEEVVGTGSNLEYNFTYDEIDGVNSSINICDEFDVTDVVQNSTLGIIQISNTGVCVISIDDTLLEEMQFDLVYVQRYGPDLNIQVNVTRNKSLFELSSLNEMSNIYIGRTISVDLTYYRSENNVDYFIDAQGNEQAFTSAERSYSIGDTVMFELDVVNNTSNLVMTKSHNDLDDVEREYMSFRLNLQMLSPFVYNISEFELEQIGDDWFVDGTQFTLEQYELLVFGDGIFIPYENQTYTIKWINLNGEFYIVDMYQTHPPSMLIFYAILGLMGVGLIALIVWKWKTRSPKVIPVVVEEEQEEVVIEEITKEEELILINELIMNRITDLLEKAAEKSESMHKGNMTWREYTNEITNNLEDANIEEWDALTDVLERCAYYKESLEWIHFNYVEGMYQETYDKLETEDKVKTKKY